MSTCYHVSPTGDDSNDGTSEGAAWKTIAKVQSFQSKLKPGDSVLLQRGGVWHEQLEITNVFGTRTQPITIGNYGQGSLPVIDGGGTRSTPGRDYCIYAVNTKFGWITISGIECRNVHKQAITFQAYSGVGTNGVGIVVQNSYIHHDGPGACMDCGTRPISDPGGYFNQLDAQFTTGVKFENNVLDHLGGHNAVNIHYDTGGPVVSGNLVGTTASWCNHNCVDLKGVVGAQVTNNVVACPTCNSSTAAFYTENTGYREVSAETINYAGNTIADVPIGFQVESGGRCTSGQCSIHARYESNIIREGSPSSYSFLDTSCANHSLEIELNVIEGGRLKIDRHCSIIWRNNVTADRSTVHSFQTSNEVGFLLAIAPYIK